MEKVLIGKIVNAVGLKGEVKVYNYSDSPEIYATAEAVYVDDELMEVENLRLQKNMVILKLAGIEDRNAAEAAEALFKSVEWHSRFLFPVWKQLHCKKTLWRKKLFQFPGKHVHRRYG